MKDDVQICASHAIETLAKRDGVDAEVVRNEIAAAIMEAQKDPSIKSQLLWGCMNATGSTPSPEELIIWVAHMLGYGVSCPEP